MKPQPTDTFAVKKKADLDNLAAFRSFLSQACNQVSIDDETAFDLQFVVDEVCTNIISYAYPDRAPGDIEVILTCYPDRLTVTIVDDGNPFPPEDAAEPDMEADWPDRPIGGLGWFLIKDMMDEIHYEPDNGQGNRLLLVKKL